MIPTNEPPLCIDIESYVPHRAPFLLIDAVMRYTENEIWVRHFVKEDSFYVQGHFPNKPLMPGVLQIEALAQAAALLSAMQDKLDVKQDILVFSAIEKAKFKRPITPDCQLDICVKILKQKQQIYKYEGHAYLHGEVACKALFSAGLTHFN